LVLVTATGHRPVTVTGIVAYGSADGPFDTTAVLLPAGQAQPVLGITDSYDQILVDAPPGALPAVVRAVGPVTSAGAAPRWQLDSRQEPGWRHRVLSGAGGRRCSRRSRPR
jgi:hypothetical protein